MFSDRGRIGFQEIILGHTSSSELRLNKTKHKIFGSTPAFRDHEIISMVTVPLYPYDTTESDESGPISGTDKSSGPPPPLPLNIPLQGPWTREGVGQEGGVDEMVKGRVTVGLTG